MSKKDRNDTLASSIFNPCKSRVALVSIFLVASFFTILFVNVPGGGIPPPGTLTKRIVKKLATKKIETSATLDLHGLNIEDAKVSFLSFLDTCWKYKYSYVLIITGKGKGILKNAFIEWLKEDEIFPLIIGYSIAHRLQGGDGAFVLHLRKR